MCHGRERASAGEAKVMTSIHAQLAQFLDRRKSPFAWGVNDCCLFAADWVLRRTGVDPAEALRGRYDSESGAQALLRRKGGLARVVSACLGQQPLHEPLRATTGDIVMLDGPTLGRRLPPLVLGIVSDRRVIVMTPSGLRHEPVTCIRAAWSIG